MVNKANVGKPEKKTPVGTDFVSVAILRTTRARIRIHARREGMTFYGYVDRMVPALADTGSKFAPVATKFKK